MRLSFLRYVSASAALALALSGCGKITSAEDTASPELQTELQTELYSAEAPVPGRSVDTNEAEDEVPTEPFTLDISIREDYEASGSHVLDGFEAVLQEPELPAGCEATSLTSVLNYLGFDVDKLTIADEFMPISLAGEVVMDEAYVGSPHYDGFGCNANVIVQTADKYFASVDSPCYAEELTGTELTDLFYQIDEGRPVIVWSTIDLTVSYPEYVWTAGNGKELVFDWYQHCMVLTGYDLDEQVVYVADPLKGNVTYPLSSFENIYGIMGKQAVVICGDADVRGSHVTTDAERSVSMPTLREIENGSEAAEVSVG